MCEFENDTDADLDPTHYRHRWMLSISFAVCLLAVLLTVRPDQRVAVRGFSEYPLPESCMSKSLMGFECPGCGLTRSVVYLAEGDLRASYAQHHLGWLMALAIVIQFPYRIYMLRRGPQAPLRGRLPALFSTTLIVLLFGNWILSNIR